MVRTENKPTFDAIERTAIEPTVYIVIMHLN